MGKLWITRPLATTLDHTPGDLSRPPVEEPPIYAYRAVPLAGILFEHGDECPANYIDHHESCKAEGEIRL